MKHFVLTSTKKDYILSIILSTLPIIGAGFPVFIFDIPYLIFLYLVLVPAILIFILWHDRPAVFFRIQDDKLRFQRLSDPISLKSIQSASPIAILHGKGSIFHSIKFFFVEGTTPEYANSFDGWMLNKGQGWVLVKLFNSREQRDEGFNIFQSIQTLQ